MSDEKSPVEEPVSSETSIDRDGDAPARTIATPVMALAFVIIALFGMLIVMAVKGRATISASSKDELAKARAELNAISNEYNRERIAMGLRPIEGTAEPISDIADRLKKDADSLVTLAGSYQKLLAEKEDDILAREAEILRAEKLRQSLAAESSRLQSELQRALVSGSNADLLARDLADTKAQRDALRKELSAARTQSSGVSDADHADLKRQYAELLRAKEFYENRVKELEGDLTKAKLFASSETELLPAAVALFRRLRELEGLPDSDLTTAYSSLGVELGANVLHTLTFATGSSAITPEDEVVVRNLIAELPDGDLLFVIGYASETGNVDSNQRLSSDRATAVAQYFTSLKRPGQLAQAVYLGQTDRFSSRIPERNQLVEIWRIRKK